MRVRWFHSPGWYGLRLGRNYWILRDVERKPLLFTERNGIHQKQLWQRGLWELRVK